MKIIGANITGSFILNNQDVTTTIQTSNTWSGSVATDITALNAATVSLNAATASLLNYTASNNAAISDILLETASLNAATASLLNYTASQNSRNGTYATTGSNTFGGIQTVNSNLVVTGSITAATLVVQTITSSVDFVTGSTRFGSLAANTHVFTGSMSVTGSVTATSFAGSGANLTSIPNAALSNSTISGISLGSNLATLTIGNGLSGTSYNGSTGITIANTGILALSGGTGITVSGPNSNLTITNTITNTNQLTNGAGFITSAGTAAAANSVPWSGVNSGYRDNYDLGFRPPNNDGTYAGFRFASPGSDGNAGYFLIRGGTDNDVYTQNGLTIVADLGWLTLAQRTTAGKGVRIMTGVSSTTRMDFTTAGAINIYGALVATGDITAFSDRRVKENIVTIDNALDKVTKLRGVYYNRTDVEDKSQKIGVIAQEIQEVLPQVVLEENDRLSVAYGNLAGVFIEAIKEQQTQIEELKTIINGLTK